MEARTEGRVSPVHFAGDVENPTLLKERLDGSAGDGLSLKQSDGTMAFAYGRFHYILSRKYMKVAMMKVRIRTPRLSQALLRFAFGTLVSVAAMAFMARSRGAEPAWFADGYHGGIYGHYPPSFTQFIVDALRQHPDWRLNLEIEPETWDFARTNTPEAYQALKAFITDPAAPRRIEFVNPAYGQSYLWNISGESVVQQLERGLRKIREHFPQTEVATYCTEEPCFTSALPGILKSFGFKYRRVEKPQHVLGRIHPGPWRRDGQLGWPGWRGHSGGAPLPGGSTQARLDLGNHGRL